MSKSTDEEKEEGKKKGKGLLGAIKGAIFEEEPETEKPADPPSAPPPAPVIAPTYTTAGPIDPEARKLLDRHVAEAAAPAYSVVRAFVAKNGKYIPDEIQRFKAAIDNLPPELTAAQVLIDIDEAVAVVEKDRQESAARAKKEIADRVGAKEARQAEIVQRLKELEDEKVRLDAEKTQLVADIDTERKSIEDTSRRFDAAAVAYREELLKDKTKFLQAKGA